MLIFQTLNWKIPKAISLYVKLLILSLTVRMANPKELPLRVKKNINDFYP
ncbi:hypothetical protein NIES22_60970 [Calothrix brevissima NIES-22]|nr:hypothetical protein NIES22_60970 [Calothrix brevissima NIES-22]